LCNLGGKMSKRITSLRPDETLSKEELLNKRRVLVSYGVILTTLFIMFILLYVVIIIREPRLTPEQIIPTLQINISTLGTQVAPLNAQVLSLEQSVSALGQISPNMAVSAELIALQTDLAAIATRLNALEQAILDNPAKAIALPLLNQDVLNIREKQQTDVQTIRSDIAQIYDLGKWFIGLMFTMALGILGLAISNFLPKRQPRRDNAEPAQVEETQMDT
jgi:hypothetical protein